MKVCYRLEYVWCGKGCHGCPHGPYWYAYAWSEGRTRKRYVGKIKPGSFATPAEPPNPLDAILTDKASPELAKQVLGMTGLDRFSQKDLRDCYRQASLKEHPDRGGSDRGQMRVNAAFEILRPLARRES